MGPEHRLHLNKVELDFSRPGKPTDNAFIEAFNSRLRQECLNASWFLSMADARTRIEEWTGAGGTGGTGSGCSADD